MEKKSFHCFGLKAGAEGIVEAIVAVMGNVDDGGDVIHDGAFTKTISERMGKVKVLDAHRTDSTMRLIGKPMEMREMKREELPAELVKMYPEATGALWTKTQFLLDTPEGAGVFKRIQAGVLDEWSIGYDALDKDFSKLEVNGKEVTVRNLRTLKLYEYSPVLWGMNQATGTLTAKRGTGGAKESGGSGDPPGAGGGEEGKPYGVRHEGGVWKVYKLDEEGEPTGEALGEHETEEEAEAQVRALYAAEKRGTSAAEKRGTDANEDKSENLSEYVENVREAFSGQYNKPDHWDYWVMAVYEDYVLVEHSSSEGRRNYQIAYSVNEENEVEFAPRAEWIEGSMEFVAGVKAGRVLAARNAKRILEALEALTETLRDAGLMEVEEEEENREDSKSAKKEIINEITAPDRAAEDDKKAGPGDDGHRAPPTDDELLRLIEIEEQEIQLVNLRD